MSHAVEIEPFCTAPVVSTPAGMDRTKPSALGLGTQRLSALLASLVSTFLALTGCVDPTQSPGGEATTAQLGQPVVAPFQRNVALRNPATQSSTLNSSFPAGNANDGGVGFRYPLSSVPIISHTAPESQPWWQVDTLDVLWINEVVIYGRSDCCQDRLKPFEVRVSTDGTNWTQIYYSTVNPPFPLRIEANVAARYVQVRLLAYGTLELDEVQVLQNEKGTNLARLGTASQSSTGYGGLAAFAIDGNTSGDYSSGSVTHTTFEATPWWQVDLAKSRFIGDVKIHGRTDCCADRLSDFDVKVSNDLVTWYVVPFTGRPTFPLTVPINKMGRYVRVQLRGTNALSLAEVEVSAVPSNLARGKSTNQSNTLPGGESWRAVDDNTDGVFANGSVAHTKQIDYTNPAWWEVSLGGVRAISGVVVYNRSDCCVDRVRNYRVFASELDTTLPFPSRYPVQIGSNTFRASDLGSYTLWNGFAQSIRIEIPAGADLNVAEVKVLGPTKQCPYGQTVLDNDKCVTLRKWDYGTPPPADGTRVAMRARSMTVYPTLQPWNRWLGLDGGRINAMDSDLRTRDLFVISSYQPPSGGGFGLPWFRLQSQSGGYLKHGGAELGGILYDSASADDAWILTRGINNTYATSLQRIVTTISTLDNRWKYRADWYTALAASPSSYYANCLAPYWIDREQRTYFTDARCDANGNNIDFYIVE